MGKLKLVHKKQNRKYYYTNFRHPLTGKLVQISTKTSNLKEAQQFAAARLIQLKGSRLAPEIFGDYKLSDAIQRFIEVKRYQKKEHRLEYLKNQLGNIRLCDLNYDLVYSEVIKPKIKLGCENSSINQYLRFLRAVLSKSKSWGWIKDIPEIDDLEEVIKIRTRVLDLKNEYHRLLDELPEYLIDPIHFYLLTGLRKTELVKLSWAQVTNDFSGLIFSGNQKNKDSDITTLPDSARQILRKQLGKHPHYVFANPRTKLGNLGDFKKAYKNAQKRAGIKNITVHDLRRTYATLPFNAKGTDEIKEAIGRSLRQKSPKSIKFYIPEVNKKQQESLNSVVEDTIADLLTI